MLTTKTLTLTDGTDTNNVSPLGYTSISTNVSNNYKLLFTPSLSDGIGLLNKSGNFLYNPALNTVSVNNGSTNYIYINANTPKIEIEDGTDTNIISSAGYTTVNDETSDTPNYITFVDTTTNGINNIRKSGDLKYQPDTQVLTVPVIKPSIILDNANSAGTLGQILSCAGPGLGISWIDRTLTGAVAGDYYTTGLKFTLNTYGESVITAQTTIVATGGQTVGLYRDISGVLWKYHLYTTVGTNTFNVSSGISGYPIQILLLGGGGGGGNRNASIGCGGAGGGEVIFVQGFQTTPQLYTFTVGDGGAGGSSASGSDGGSSTFAPAIAAGGGGGSITTGRVVSGTVATSAANTGSGSGGGGTTAAAGGTATKVTYTTTSTIDPFTTILTNYTNTWTYASSGGTAAAVSTTYAGGGGGGAGGVGTNGSTPAPGTATGGDGGNGISIKDFYQLTPILVGGGSGGVVYATSNAVAGSSATTYGAGTSSQGTGTAGAANRGGGGGCSATAPGVAGGKGGSGFVCIRYPFYN